MAQALTAAAPLDAKVLAVDTSCQVPMQTVKCSTSKAYIFRSATEKPRKERMDAMPYSDSGQIAQIAPYASQSGAEGEAAAGAEDHPDAQGGHSWGCFVGGIEGSRERLYYGFVYIQDGVSVCWLGPDVGSALPLTAVLLVFGEMRDMNKGKNSETNAGCKV